MESLYVCLFSNGHIKVGRSIDPQARIATHADRVSCMGVELVDRFIAECAGPAIPREAMLIGRCADHAATRHHNEWFTGLDFLAVCEWAGAFALTPEAAPQPAEAFDPAKPNFRLALRTLKARGLTQTQIAARVGSTQSNVSDIASGVTADPRYSIGASILALLAETEAI